MKSKREIGTAWSGKHVVIIRCMPYQNQFIGLYTSLHAPTEPPSPHCAETLSQFLSIGYTLIDTYTISATEVQYILMK
jgi:hypothetical protein